MTKDELTLFLREYEVVRERLQRLSGEAEELKTNLGQARKEAAGKSAKSTLHILAAVLLVLLLTLLPTPARMLSPGSAPTFWGWLAILALALDLAFLLGIRLQIRKLRRQISQLKEDWERVIRRRGKASAHLERLDERGILPEEYRSRADRLRVFLESGRADTLKEAINLLELELSQKALIREMAEQFDRIFARMEETLEHVQEQSEAVRSLGEDLQQCRSAAEFAAGQLSDQDQAEE